MNVTVAPTGETLAAMVGRTDIVVAPGCYDAFTALIIEQTGFRAAYLSGASIAYARFGRPDIGLVGMEEVAANISAIRERIAIPLIVDADTGFGNALNVMRTIKLFERMGASAIQIEDQTSPKRCGHLDEKTLVTADEMVGKVKAALDARTDADTLIIARTDAIAVEGLDAALDRAARYAEAGADILFVEAPRNEDEMRAVIKRLGNSVSVMANMVEGGKTPDLNAKALQALGFSLVIFPGGTARAVGHALRNYFGSLAEHGTTTPWRDRMLDFQALQELLGTKDMLETGKRYTGENS